MRIKTLALALLTALAAPLALCGCAGPRAGDPAPSFTLNDTSGKSQALEEYSGRVVLLDFWATWCGPCVKASPMVQRLHDEFASDGLVVLAVHFDDSGDPAKYASEHGYTYTVLPKGGREVARIYAVESIPTFIVVGRDGVVTHRSLGYYGESTETKLRDAITAALKG